MHISQLNAEFTYNGQNLSARAVVITIFLKIVWNQRKLRKGPPKLQMKTSVYIPHLAQILTYHEIFGKI